MTAAPLSPAAEIADWFASAVDALAGLAAEVGAVLQAAPRRGALIAGEATEAVRPCADRFLVDHPYAVGAGATLLTQRFEEGANTLPWWVRSAQGTAPLNLDLTPGSDRFYDYQRLPYFTGPATRGGQALWGPYVDYLGADDYILTHAAALVVDGSFAGVAGYDVRVEDLETLLMPALRRLPGDAALLNASRRVILGNSGRYLVGERVRDDAPGPQPLPVPHLGLSLLVAGGADGA